MEGLPVLNSLREVEHCIDGRAARSKQLPTYLVLQALYGLREHLTQYLKVR